MDKNKWIEEVLNSTEGMSKAKPERDLFPGIEGKLMLGKKHVITLKTISLAAASIALLIVMNITLILSSSSSKENTAVAKSDMDQVIEYYGLTDSQLY